MHACMRVQCRKGVAIGGDRYPGSRFIDHLLRYQAAAAKRYSCEPIFRQEQKLP